MGDSTFIYLVLGFFLLLGGLFLKIGLEQMRRGKLALSWQQVPGQITASEVYVNSPYDAESRSYEPRVTYTYLVNGNYLTSTTIAFGDLKNQYPATANEYVSKYPVGRGVTVFHDPQNPQSSVLEPGTAGSRHTVLFAIAIFVFVPIFFAFHSCIRADNAALERDIRERLPPGTTWHR